MVKSLRGRQLVSCVVVVVDLFVEVVVDLPLPTYLRLRTVVDRRSFVTVAVYHTH